MHGVWDENNSFRGVSEESKFLARVSKENRQARLIHERRSRNARCRVFVERVQ